MTYGSVLTVLFFIAFIAMVVWVYRPGRKKDYEQHGYMAVETDRRDDDKGRHGGQR